ncbi:hypothetical protein Scep_022208 [Stephania cephalantha]|uniref:Uncharacterized protein n=1 Tax=Stephania cephalantha TaxID=152367 RepID=A0AAP0F5Q6_9MAGN
MPFSSSGISHISLSLIASQSLSLSLNRNNPPNAFIAKGMPPHFCTISSPIVMKSGWCPLC